jgi:hypothetical protein
LLWRFGAWQKWRTAVSIRRIYRAMMQLAATNGYPKLDAETPYEYLKTLAQWWPHHPVEVRLITDAYVKLRYGEIPETTDELAAIWLAWQRLQQAQPGSVATKNEGLERPFLEVNILT